MLITCRAKIHDSEILKQSSCSWNRYEGRYHKRNYTKFELNLYLCGFWNPMFLGRCLQIASEQASQHFTKVWVEDPSAPKFENDFISFMKKKFRVNRKIYVDYTSALNIIPHLMDLLFSNPEYVLNFVGKNNRAPIHMHIETSNFPDPIFNLTI